MIIRAVAIFARVAFTVARTAISIAANVTAGALSAGSWPSPIRYHSSNVSVGGSSKAGVRGANQVIGNIKKYEAAIEQAAQRGVIKAAIFVLRDVEQTPPKIPVDEGNLRASAFTHAYKGTKGPAVQLGFSAYYAWYVHEMVGANFQRPGAGAKFLEASLKRNKAKILDIIASEVRKVIR